MTIDYGHARSWIGRAVYLRRGEEKSLDRLVDARDAGQMLVLERTGTALPIAIDEMRPVTPDQAAQIIVDLNAAAGKPHDPATLTPSAGALVAIFPGQFAGGEAEALKLLLTRTPSSQPGSP